MVATDTLFQTLWRGTYLYSLYSLYKGLPPGPKRALQIMSLAAYTSETNKCIKASLRWLHLILREHHAIHINFLFIINYWIMGHTIILLINYGYIRQMTICIVISGNYLRYTVSYCQFLFLYHFMWGTRCWAHHLKVMILNSNNHSYFLMFCSHYIQ